MLVHLVKQIVALLYFISALIVFVLCLHPLEEDSSSSASNRPKLSFSIRNNERTFRILQLTDLHLGENGWTDWGPEQDRKTFKAVRTIIFMENPDLIILGGDQLTANNVIENATAYYDILANFLETQGIPYALVFGNHDDQAYEEWFPNGTMIPHPPKTSRTQLLWSDQRHALSLSREGPPSVFGVSNYMLPVYNGVEEKVKLQVVLMDSGGGMLPQEIVQSQLGEWYQSQRLDGIDAVAFQHIPTKEFYYRGGGGDAACSGFDGESGIAALQHDPVGEIFTLIRQDTRLHFLAVGHNHGNSYCCPTNDGARTTESRLHVCFGRHSGYGGYSKKGWTKGGRVYEVTLDTDRNLAEWKSWVRLENGQVTDEYSPKIIG